MKKTLAVLLMAAILLCAAPLAGFNAIDLSEMDFVKLLPVAKAAEIIYSGSCDYGSVTWVLDNAGTITFSGTGRIEPLQAEIRPLVKKAVIEEGITSLWYNAFEGCVNLESVTIPDSLNTIYSRAFKGCTRLTSFVLPKSLTMFDTGVFSGCTDLAELSVEAGNPVYCSRNNCIIDVENKQLVAGCKNSIIPSDGSVTEIISGAFEGCTGMKTVTIPGAVTKIRDTAFLNCTGLTKLTVSADNPVYRSKGNCIIKDNELVLGCQNSVIPSDGSVTGISSWAFRNCTGLTGLHIPETVTYISSDAFLGCTGLSELTVDGNNPNYFSKGNCIVAKGWGGRVILGCKNSVLPADGSIAVIAEKAFYGCTGLTDITIPDSVNRIEKEAFSGCTELKSVTIPDGVTYIGDCVFENCKAITDITIPKSVTHIGIGAFYRCTGLTKVTIPDGVTSIDEQAFSGCTGLTSVSIPDSVTTVGIAAFMNCSALESVKLSANMTDIEMNIFSGCSNLKDVVIPNNVKKISIGAFDGCKSLTAIAIPSSVDYIDNRVFDECEALEQITVEEGNSFYFSKDNCLIAIETKELILGCKNSIIPNDDSVTSIGNSAFYGCTGLTDITIPNSVTSIGWNTFYGCDGLTTVYYDGSREMWQEMYINSEGNYPLYTAEIVFAIPDPHTEHTWDEGEVMTPATCTEKGVKIYTCTVCQETKNEEIPALDHTIVVDTAIAPTCTANGKTEGCHCSVCGETIKAQETIKAVGHHYCAWETLDEIQHQRVCANDITHVEKEDHQWNEGKVTKEATFGAAGEMTFTCTVCGATKTEPIPKKEFAPAIDAENAKEIDNNVFTVPGMTAKELKALAGDGAAISRADGTVLTEKDAVGSGMILTKPDGKKLTIVIKGDNDGDGKVSSADARLALRCSVSLEKFTDWQTAASLVDGGEKVTSADARLILRASVGLEDAGEWCG